MLVTPMPEQPSTDDIKKNLKEAAALLNVLDLDDKKLEAVLSKLSETVTGDPGLKTLIDTLSKKNEQDKNGINLESINQMMGTEEVIPMISAILQKLSQDPGIINHFEKEILPILFSR